MLFAAGIDITGDVPPVEWIGLLAPTEEIPDGTYAVVQADPLNTLVSNITVL